jgi:asparagine synthase (glutamine-hydrolysing)
LVNRVCSGLTLDRSEHRRTVVDQNAGLGVSARFAAQQVYESPHVIVACDAELYNESEINALLGQTPGAVPEMHTAAAVAGLYKQFGSKCFEKLRGDFSVIVWDRHQRVLLAATDHFAIRPLVYYTDGRTLLITSRIEGLLASQCVSKELNPRAVANYLNYGVNLAPETMFTGVVRLVPGTFLTASEGQVAVKRYWDMCYPEDVRANENELKTQLHSVVEQSVRAHCKNDSFSDVGAFLSGGTDSSTVVGLMSRLSRGPVNTFSIGFEDPRFNELEYARIAARAFQTRHHEYVVSASDCIDALPEMIRYFDEPFGNASAIPTYFCARLAAEHGVRTLLAGDGGDELFGGNARYQTDNIFEVYQKVPQAVRKTVIEPLLASATFLNGFVGVARKYVRRSNLPQPLRYFSYHLLLANAAADVLQPSFIESLGNYSVLETPNRYYWEGPARQHLDRLLYVDLKITLADNDLLKVTRMAEVAGVRTRFPLLDRVVAEMSGRIPPELKVKRFDKRYLFKCAFRELLPREVIKKRKHGFGIPVAEWMRSDKRMRELTRDVLLSPRTYERGYLRRTFVEDVFAKHESDVTSFYGDMLWTFLALELWFRQFVDQPTPAAV